MSAVSKTTALIAVLGFIALFGSFGYLTLKQVEQVKTKIVNNSKQLAEVYVAEPAYAEDNVYDAIFCPNAEVAKTKQCNYVGGKAFQDLLNNLPATTPDKPFKIFLRGGEYTGFVPVKINYVPSEGAKAREFYQFSRVDGKHLVIIGENPTQPIFNFNNLQGGFTFINSTITIKNIVSKDLDFRCINYPGCINAGVTYITHNVFAFISSTATLSNLSSYGNTLLFSVYTGSTARATNINMYDASFITNGGNLEINGLLVKKTKSNNFYTIEEMSLDNSNINALSVIKNSVFINQLPSDANAGNFIRNSDGTVTIENSYFYGQPVNNQPCIQTVDKDIPATINLVNSVVTNCKSGIRGEGGGTSTINIKNSFLYNNTKNVDVASGAFNYLGKPLNSDYFVNPQIPFNINNLNDPTNFVLPTGNIAINAGDTTIKDIDGSVSDIGVLGGPNVCTFKPNFTGCPTVNTTTPEPILRTATPTITAGVTPIATVNPTPIASVLPSPINIDADVNNDGTINLTDVILVVQAVFN